MLVLVVIGGSVGFVSGLVGIGGGTLLVPLVLWWYGGRGIPGDLLLPLTFGTTLTVGAATALSGALVHLRHTALRGPAIYLGAGGLMGAPLGSWLAAQVLSPSTLRVLLGLGLMTAAGLMWLSPEPRAREEVRSPWLLGCVGSVVAALATMVGLGGAAFVLPVLAVMGRFPIHRAVGVSTGYMTIVACAGAFSYAWHGAGRSGLPTGALGFVDLPTALLVAAPSALAAQLGARLAHRINPLPFRRLVGALFFALGLRIAWSARDG